MYRNVKKRVLSVCLALCLMISGVLVGFPASSQAAGSYGLADSIQDGVILHCFNWKYNDIKAELPNIAKAGFTSVQTSPAQLGAKSGIWYWLYQPLGFYVASNDLGTKEELRALCTEAEKYGINVVVDVVANHLAGDHTNIQSDLKSGQYWHNYGTVHSWADRYQVTHGEIGMPDLNSENSYVAYVVSNYINELKSLGVDGIRWDAAKHIGLPSEGCNFWPTVTSQGLYHYGEILVGPDDRSTGNEGLMKEYTNYMTVTDSTYGKILRDAFASGSVPSAYGNWASRGISNDKLIYWGESHDTWSNNKDWGYSNDMSQNVIDRAYAVAASRNDVTALYFSRPASTYKEGIMAGQKGSTHFTSTEVAAVNQFHNAMNGQPDYYTTGSNCSVVTRKTGAVVVAGRGGNFNVTVPNGGGLAEEGKYVDAITGETWYVNKSTMSGKIGSTGIAVLYKDQVKVPETEESVTETTKQPETETPAVPETSETQETVTNGKVYFKNTSNWNKVYAYYWSESNKQMLTWPGLEMTNEGDGLYSINVPGAEYIIFTNGSGTQTKDLKLTGANKLYENGTWSAYQEPTVPEETEAPEVPETSEEAEEETTQAATSSNIFFKNTSNWNKVYAYYWCDSNTKMVTWPGVEMTKETDNIYGIKVPEQAQYIIFTNGSGTQTKDLTISGFGKLYDNGNWSDYRVNTSTGSESTAKNYIYYRNTGNWNKVNAYYWSNSDTKMTTWPGVAMTHVGNGVYRVEVPSNASYIIFNNGNGAQTGDLTLCGMGKIYSNGNWSNY